MKAKNRNGSTIAFINQCYVFQTVCFVLFISFPIAAFADTPTPSIEKIDPNFAAKDATGDWLWYDARELTVEGKGWADTEQYYDRLPARAKNTVPENVWGLSRHSAGICIRFVTDSPRISARWKVTGSGISMPHMPATGVSGLDLYVYGNAAWHWIANGRPGEMANEVLLAEGIPVGSHAYMLYLPLYNGTESLEIGVQPDAMMSKAAPRPHGKKKPILFYGTSITQGGCASRPGMVHTAILGRRLDWPVINLGFSGSGKMEDSLCALLAEVDAAAYVLDCLPNLTPQSVEARVEPFVIALRAARPGTPIILVENIVYQAGVFLPKCKTDYIAKNAALQAAYQRLVDQGIQGLHYVAGESLLGHDGEATVDGVHPTDLGFLRIADALEPALRRVLTADSVCTSK